MDELAATDVNPYMSYFATRFEEYQIAKFEVFLWNSFANLCELFCCSWYRFGKNVPISNLYKS